MTKATKRRPIDPNNPYKLADGAERYMVFTQLASDAGPLEEDQCDRYRYMILDRAKGTQDDGPFHYVTPASAGEMAQAIIREDMLRRAWNGEFPAL